MYTLHLAIYNIRKSAVDIIREYMHLYVSRIDVLALPLYIFGYVADLFIGSNSPRHTICN